MLMMEGMTRNVWTVGQRCGSSLVGRRESKKNGPKLIFGFVNETVNL
jgi:hypothetical protein